MTYLDEVKNSIMDVITEYLSEEEYNEFESAYDFAEYANDEFWTDDHITGNGSGSYTFSREKAKNIVMDDDFETIYNAINGGYYTYEELGKDICNGDWEKIDVICRCFVLYFAAKKFFEEHPKYDF